MPDSFLMPGRWSNHKLGDHGPFEMNQTYQGPWSGPITQLDGSEDMRWVIFTTGFDGNCDFPGVLGTSASNLQFPSPMRFPVPSDRAAMIVHMLSHNYYQTITFHGAFVLGTGQTLSWRLPGDVRGTQFIDSQAYGYTINWTATRDDNPPIYHPDPGTESWNITMISAGENPFLEIEFPEGDLNGTRVVWRTNDSDAGMTITGVLLGEGANGPMPLRVMSTNGHDWSMDTPFWDLWIPAGSPFEGQRSGGTNAVIGSVRPTFRRSIQATGSGGGNPPTISETDTMWCIGPNADGTLGGTGWDSTGMDIHGNLLVLWADPGNLNTSAPATSFSGVRTPYAQFGVPLLTPNRQCRALVQTASGAYQFSSIFIGAFGVPPGFNIFTIGGGMLQQEIMPTWETFGSNVASGELTTFALDTTTYSTPVQNWLPVSPPGMNNSNLELLWTYLLSDWPMATVVRGTNTALIGSGYTDGSLYSIGGGTTAVACFLDRSSGQFALYTNPADANAGYELWSNTTSMDVDHALVDNGTISEDEYGAIYAAQTMDTSAPYPTGLPTLFFMSLCEQNPSAYGKNVNEVTGVPNSPRLSRRLIEGPATCFPFVAANGKLRLQINYVLGSSSGYYGASSAAGFPYYDNLTSRVTRTNNLGYYRGDGAAVYYVDVPLDDGESVSVTDAPPALVLGRPTAGLYTPLVSYYYASEFPDIYYQRYPQLSTFVPGSFQWVNQPIPGPFGQPINHLVYTYVPPHTVRVTNGQIFDPSVPRNELYVLKLSSDRSTIRVVKLETLSNYVIHPDPHPFTTITSQFYDLYYGQHNPFAAQLLLYQTGLRAVCQTTATWRNLGVWKTGNFGGMSSHWIQSANGGNGDYGIMYEDGGSVYYTTLGYHIDQTLLPCGPSGGVSPQIFG